MDWLVSIYVAFFGAESVVAPEYLVMFVLILAVVFVVRREKGSFWAWAFPRDVWLTRTAFADLSFFTFNRVLGLLGLFSRLSVTPLVAFWAASGVGAVDGGLLDLGPWGLALVIFVTLDFAQYAIHRFFHNSPVFWPFHAVHHSASKLNPFTSYRSHPFFVLISSLYQSLVVGVVVGLVAGSVDGGLTLAEFGGANAFLVLSNILVSHLQHSHVWISFGPVLGRIFISPAQHQVHHSVKPEHHNKNYGNTLAIWDWMFGTLYITGPQEAVVFGLDGKMDAPLMTQKFSKLLFDPFRRSGLTIKRRLTARAKTPSPGAD